MSFELQETTLHGHRVAYRMAGSGPPVLLIHGVASSSADWEVAGPMLARRHSVLAPDLLGHGASAKPRGDYSMGAFASGIRDLAVSLGVGTATIVGHSLGGGVAMQFAYQFPERAERLVLVGSGGLGQDVHGILRAATLPGSELVLPLLAAHRLMNVGMNVGRALDLVGLRAEPNMHEFAHVQSSPRDLEDREYLFH